MDGFIAAIEDRKISKAACQKFGVTIDYAPDGSIAHHWYPHYHQETGELVASKKRDCAKKAARAKGAFKWTGDREGIGLFGQKACKGGGKYLTITEGELDCLSVDDMFNNKWDVCSLRDGTGGAVRDIKESLEFIESYQHVVLCLDQDEAGQKCLDDIKDLISPNKLRIVSLSRKDANAMLMAGKIKEFVKSWWDAKDYRPDGLVSIRDTLSAVKAYRDTPYVPYAWQGLQNMLLGQRKQEIVIWAADTGMGKTTLMREVVDNIVNQTETDRVGGLYLEESIAKTTLGWMSFAAGRPLHKELAELSDAELEKYWELATRGNRIELLDHQGWQNNMDTLKARVRYMKRALNCEWIILDHLHIALSSIAGATGDWSGIDELMTEFRSLVHELDVGLHLVSHISGDASDRRLRGSKGISQLADAVIFAERDKDAEGDEKNITRLYVDKNRFGGDVGFACALRYDPYTGRMKEESGSPAPLSEPEDF